jgi:plastocyanin
MNFANRRPLLLLLAAAGLMVGAAACGGSSSASETDPTAPPVQATNTPAGDGDSGPSVQTIEVSMLDNHFEPKDIVVPVGQKVTIVASNDGVAVHNMVVKDTEFKSETMVMAGAESSFDVIFDSPGTYDFQCDFHVPDMVGTITAE